jgi:hypothetical protein
MFVSTGKMKQIRTLIWWLHYTDQTSRSVYFMLRAVSPSRFSERAQVSRSVYFMLRGVSPSRFSERAQVLYDVDVQTEQASFLGS